MRFVPTGRHAELFEAVRQATEGTAYLAIETPDGFAVEREVSTAESPDSATTGAQERVTHDVRLTEKTMRYTKTCRVAGDRTISSDYGSSVRRGSIVSASSGVSFQIGRREDGSFGVIKPPPLDPEGDRLIQQTAAAHGWTERVSREKVMGRTMAVLGVIAPLVGIILFFALYL